MTDGSAALGRAALGQKDVSIEAPTFLNTPYQISTNPGGQKEEVLIEVNPGTFGYTLTWGIDQQSGCGDAWFQNEFTQGTYSNTLSFIPSEKWTPPYRIDIFVTDGHYTIRTSVFIQLATLIALPMEIVMDDYKIYLANREFRLGAEIDVYTEAVFVPKFNDVGNFSITMDILDAPKAGWGETESGTYGNIVLTRNEVPIFWGIITEFERNWDDGTDELILKGSDTMKHLQDRTALPKPDRTTSQREGFNNVPDYASRIFDVRPKPTIGAVSQVGGGNSVNDIKNVAGGGTSVGTARRTYRVWVVTAGSANEPAKFAWREVEQTNNADTKGIFVTGKAQSIDNGVVTIQFNKTTGFAVGENRYWTFTFRETTSTAEQVIKSYVKDNLGSGALPFRQIPGFQIQPTHSPPLGSLARGRARFDNLLEFIQDIALPDLRLPENQRKELQFYMEGLTFKTREVADLTKKVKISKDLDTLRRFSYTAKASAGNYLYVGGKGSEGDREVIEWGNDEGSIPRYGLIERFVDASSSESLTDLYATAVEELVKTQDNTVMEVEPIDKLNMTVIDDYWVGDKVTAIVDGSTFEEVIREATIRLDGNEGATITPVLGTPDTRRQELIKIFRLVRKLEGRLSPFERR